jgi:hypothetical protein
MPEMSVALHFVLFCKFTPETIFGGEFSLDTKYTFQKPAVSIQVKGELLAYSVETSYQKTWTVTLQNA